MPKLPRKEDFLNFLAFINLTMVSSVRLRSYTGQLTGQGINKNTMDILCPLNVWGYILVMQCSVVVYREISHE